MSHATRDIRIDALRGLALAAVVLVHALGIVSTGGYTRDPAHFVLYSIANPLFFAIAGYVSTRSTHADDWSYLPRRARALLLPYFSWTIVWWIVSSVRGTAQSTLVPTLVESIWNPATDWSLWFFWALFVFGLAHFLIRRVADDDRFQLVVAGCVFAVGALIAVERSTAYFDVRSLHTLYPFYVAGFAASRLEQFASTVRRVRYLLPGLFAALITLAWVVRPAVVDSIDIGVTKTALLVLASYQGLIVLTGAAGIAFLYWAYGRLPDAAIAPQAWLGRRTAGVYAMHKRFMFLLFEAGLSGGWALWIAGLAGTAVITLGIERVPGARTVFLGQSPRHFHPQHTPDSPSSSEMEASS